MKQKKQVKKEDVDKMVELFNQQMPPRLRIGIVPKWIPEHNNPYGHHVSCECKYCLEGYKPNDDGQ